MTCADRDWRNWKRPCWRRPGGIILWNHLRKTAAVNWSAGNRPGNPRVEPGRIGSGERNPIFQFRWKMGSSLTFFGTFLLSGVFTWTGTCCFRRAGKNCISGWAHGRYRDGSCSWLCHRLSACGMRGFWMDLERNWRRTIPCGMAFSYGIWKACSFCGQKGMKRKSWRMPACMCGTAGPGISGRARELWQRLRWNAVKKSCTGWE